MTPAREGLERVALRPIETAPKDRTPLLLFLKNPLPEPERTDLDHWGGVAFIGRHNGVEPDGFDMGWSFAAPVGQGGFPDRWIEGWLPLAPDKQSLTVGEADAREVLAARMRNPLIREAVAAGTADHIGLTVREAVDAMLAFASTIQDGARVRIAQALYEHWVDEDFSEEYCGWDALIGKETWLARADAAIRKLKEEA